MRMELLDTEKDWFVETPSSLSPAKYATVAIVRRTQDYAAFRTEADKYTNSVATPASRNSEELMERALMLASKQKAVERRHQNKIVRDLLPEAGQCYLKDYLCLECPVCMLNGGIKAVKGAGEIAIKSRVLYQTAFSVMPFENIVESITFNAVDEKTTKTDQALGERELIKPDSHFVSVVSILAPTLDELKLYLYSLLHTTRYGAETRGIGVMENRLLSLVLSDAEEFSALGLTMDVYGELVEGKESPKLNHESILDVIQGVSMKRLAGARIRKVFTGEEIVTLEKDLREAAPTKKWIEGMYKKATEYKKFVVSKQKLG